MKKILIVLIFILSLISCQNSKTDTKKIGVVLSTLNNPFFVTMKEGIEEKAKELGYEVIVIDSQNDPAKEISGVEDLVTKGVNVLLINPTDSDAVVNSVKIANENKIPVITLDRASNGGEIISHVASDNVKGGELAGQYILEKLNGKGKVVELEGISGTTAARDRGAGFNNIISGKLEVVAKQTADFDRTKGLNVMENILQSQPDIQAVFAHNDEMALGALKAIEASKRDIIVVGFDAIDDAINSIKEGKLSATIAQQPKLIGEKGVEIANKILNNEQVDKYIPIELKLIQN